MLYVLFTLFLTVAAVSSPKPKLQVVPNAYILKLNNESHISASTLPTRSILAFHKRAEDIDYSVRKEFPDPSLFSGLSITPNENVPADKAEDLLLSIPDVVAIWP